MKRQKANSLENITWSELRKQNKQAKKVYSSNVSVIAGLDKLLCLQVFKSFPDNMINLLVNKQNALVYWLGSVIFTLRVLSDRKRFRNFQETGPWVTDFKGGNVRKILKIVPEYFFEVYYPINFPSEL